MKRKITLSFGLLTVLALGFTAYLYAASTASTGPQPQVRVNPDGTVAILFQGTPGSAYQIQSKTSFLGSNWTIEAGSVVAQSNLTAWVDSQPDAAKKFYRVVQATNAASSAAAVSATVTAAVTAPGVREIADAKQLLTALNAGDNLTTSNILAGYGISSSTLAAMAGRLGQTPAPVQLQETFLKAATSLSLDGRTNDIQARLNTATALGYGRPVWVSRWLDTNWTARCDAELAQSPVAPIAALDVTLNDTNFIRFFQWYDRYADRLHSVVLNWEHLNNHGMNGASFANANTVLSGMYKLIKARKPDAFVWVYVVKQDVDNEAAWLQALSFRPDGLFVGNLRQFHSPFAAERSKLAAVVGSDTPMVVAGFYGYRPQMKAAGKALSVAKKIQDPAQRQAAKAQAMARVKAIGQVIAPQLGSVEQHLKDLGYRGLMVNGLVAQAVEGN